MGITKTQHFSKKQNQMAIYAKALGHPARLAILEHIIAAKACICADLVEKLPLSQSTISQHLKELKDVGFIKSEIQGPKVMYTLNKKAWKDAREIFNSFLKSFKNKEED